MLRRCLCVLLAVVLLSVPAWAYTLDSSVQWTDELNGEQTTFFGVFKARGFNFPEGMRDKLKEWYSFPAGRCIATYWESDPNFNGQPSICFYLFDSPIDRLDVMYLARAVYLGTTNIPACTVFRYSYPDLELSAAVPHMFADGGSNRLGRLIFTNIQISITSNDGTDCIIDTLPNIAFQDDNGMAGGGDDGGLLDWLLGFWDAFLAFLKSIFIPEPGYFQTWVDEIRAAFSAKVGGLNNFLSSLSASFDALKNGEYSGSELSLTLPDGFFYPGYDGITVYLLSGGAVLLSWLRKVFNAVLVVFTAIVCYKKLILLIQN